MSREAADINQAFIAFLATSRGTRRGTPGAALARQVIIAYWHVETRLSRARVAACGRAACGVVVAGRAAVPFLVRSHDACVAICAACADATQGRVRRADCCSGRGRADLRSVGQ